MQINILKHCKKFIAKYSQDSNLDFSIYSGQTSFPIIETCGDVYCNNQYILRKNVLKDERMYKCKLN